MLRQLHNVDEYTAAMLESLATSDEISDLIIYFMPDKAECICVVWHNLTKCLASDNFVGMLQINTSIPYLTDIMRYHRFRKGDKHYFQSFLL